MNRSANEPPWPGASPDARSTRGWRLRAAWSEVSKCSPNTRSTGRPAGPSPAPRAGTRSPAFATSRRRPAGRPRRPLPMLRSSQANVEVHWVAATGSPAAFASDDTPASSSERRRPTPFDHRRRRRQVGRVVRHHHEVLVGEHRDVLLHRRQRRGRSARRGRRPPTQVPPAPSRPAAACTPATAARRSTPRGRRRRRPAARRPARRWPWPNASHSRVERREAVASLQRVRRLGDRRARGEVEVVGPGQERLHLALDDDAAPSAGAAGRGPHRRPVGVRRPQRRRRQGPERLLVASSRCRAAATPRRRPAPRRPAGRRRRPRRVYAPNVHLSRGPKAIT